MKILIVDTYYPAALKQLRERLSKLNLLSYSNQLKFLHSQHFGTGDAYSYYLNSLGYQAREIIANDEILQKSWAKEHGVNIKENHFLAKIKSLPYIYRFVGKPRWMQEILLAQIADFKPDLIYFQDLTVLDPTFLEIVHTQYALVGQIASSPPPPQYLHHFDLLLSSLPNLVDKFNKMGIKSKLFRIGFDSRIHTKVGKHKRIYETVFIGSFSPYHRYGTKLLEAVAKHITIHVWGNGTHFLSPRSALRNNFHGAVWGTNMYKILSKAKIVVNRHIDIAGDYANNMRMYEATGMGALLLTEQKKNISELFIPGKEVVTYNDAADLVNKIQYYLSHENERKKIALAGQKRTLRKHTYANRMKELVAILHKAL